MDGKLYTIYAQVSLPEGKTAQDFGDSGGTMGEELIHELQPFEASYEGIKAMLMRLRDYALANEDQIITASVYCSCCGQLGSRQSFFYHPIQRQIKRM